MASSKPTCRCGVCALCRKREHNRRWRARAKLGQCLSSVRWSSRPLLAELRRQGISQVEFATMTGISRRTILRWKTDGVSDDHADLAATHLGLHPFELWPNWLDVGEEVA